MSLEAGSEIGPYRIIERAGRGGMASVYLTADTAADGNTNLYVNQQQVANFTDDRSASSSSLAFEAFGQGGQFRILGTRGYNAP